MSGKFFVVSLHDVHAGNYHIFNEFIKKLNELGVYFVSLLVVPYMHKEHDLSFDLKFVRWLKGKQSQGHEIVLHGYYHYEEIKKDSIIKNIISSIYTAHEGEFYRISYDDAESRIRKGLELFRCNGLKAYGFVAPAWLANDNAVKVLKNTGVAYTTKLTGILLLKSDIFIKAPVLSFTSRSPLRKLLSILWARLFRFISGFFPIVRVSVHPGDLETSFLKEQLLSEIVHLKKRRNCLTYKELLDLYAESD
ncbi:polysaccharide deacetylase family protein [Flexistipes sinusarabici]|uniref:polysaccharide deacetylase family protein n=1 Tax=Flexistipes sinusarabici TaxID=2352 RepID=UPI00235336FB|nr:polysaccharide deacetylase family protein [Flexistipes sinusarabici]